MSSVAVAVADSSPIVDSVAVVIVVVVLLLLLLAFVTIVLFYKKNKKYVKTCSYIEAITL
jgi:hypothetical protein